MRSDYITVKHLFAHVGESGTRFWQRIPYLDLREVLPPELPPSVVAQRPVLGTPEMPLPWSSFVIGYGRGGREHCNFCVTVQFPDAIYKDSSHNLAEVQERTLYYITMPWFLGVACSARYRKETPGEGLRFCVPAALQQNPTDKEDVVELLKSAHQLAYRVITYLHHSPKHMTEVLCAQPRTSTKTTKLKPWVRDDLPTIIMLDPTTAARSYGMPSKVIAERHAPIPHGRRGHWRHLDDERRTWVRPAWIGSESWESAGQIYRVLSTPGQPILEAQKTPTPSKEAHTNHLST